MTTYAVTAWREPEGGWSASADGLDGAFTDGASLSEIDRNIRESIALTLDCPIEDVAVRLSVVDGGITG